MDSRYPATEILIDGDDRILELLWVKVETPHRLLFLGALYHHPKPIYEANLILSRLERTVEFLASMDPEALIILRRDFNGL